MDTLEFLQRVLPSDGFYVTTVINGPTPADRKQGYFKTVEELAKVCVRLDQTGNNTYFAVASFREKGSRKQENAKYMKVVAADIDCGEGKPFADEKEGLLALAKFVRETNLPRPMIIASGRGLHVYWIFDRDLSIEEWYPMALGLKNAAAIKGFSFDPTVPADCARVMRPVGTRNPKNNKIVRLLMDAAEITIDAFTSALQSFIGPAVAPRQVSKSTLLDSLQVRHEYPPAVPHVVKSKCQQIDWAVENQDKVGEPLWYNIIGVAAHCMDPEATAVAWSDKHPKYDHATTMRKLAQWKASTTGPATCAKFEADRPGGCKGCKFKGNISTPARLGVQYKEVAPPIVAAQQTANLIQLPKPFKRTADGIKVTIDDTDVDVCPFDIVPVGYGKDEGLGYETVRYLWNRPHVGWSKLTMRQAYLTDGHKEFASCIADQGIVLYSKRQTEYFQLMMRAYMDKLRQQQTMTNLYSTMGWKENYSRFVIGDTVIKLAPDNTAQEETITLASGAQRVGGELYGAAGSLQSWINMTSLFDKVGMPWHGFALLVGMSAPLYAFTGLKGSTLSLYGPTGGGKSLAQLWVQSVWGDPDKLHVTAKFTQNMLFNRLGLYSNMPMTIDEVTMVPDKEVGDFCYWVSQGRDKARLNRSAEERDAKTWATPVIVSTNKSWQSKLIASGLETDAQMARLLELSIPAHPMFTGGTDAGRKIHGFLTTNYGYVGRELMKRLVEAGEGAIRAMISEHTETFQSRYSSKFSGEERYWEQMVILADLVGTMAKNWGLIDFDPSKCTAWVLQQLGAVRKTAVENRMDAFDTLSEFLNDHADTAITVTHTGSAAPAPDYQRMPRADVRVRFDMYRKASNAPFDKGTVHVDRSHFRKWLSTKGVDYRAFINELASENIIATPKSGKLYLGKDTPIKVGQTYVIGINLNHPRLQGILNDADANADATLGSPLRVVT